MKGMLAMTTKEKLAQHSIRDAIESRIASLGVSGYWVAKRCPDCSEGSIYKYLSGETDGSGKVIQSIMIAAGLRITVDPKFRKENDG